MRRGSALLLVLVAMVVLAVLSSASMMSAFQEARASRSAQIQARAMSVAEFALNLQLGQWRAQRASMAVGAIDSATVGVALGDTAIVRAQRLNAVDYLVVSVGRAGIGNGLMEAQREVSLLVKVSAPNIRPGGMLTVIGDLDVQGSPTISGRNANPLGWLDCPLGSYDTSAVAYNPTSKVDIQKWDQQAIGGIRADPRAGDPRTYDTFGSETWSSLISKATVRITGNISPTPSGNSTSCNPFTSNWGEPWRGLGTVAGCYNYFPIIYSPGDLDLQNGRGQGILLVDGKLRLRGNFQFVGLILVRDELDANGNISIQGAVMIGNTAKGKSKVHGNGSLRYSRCAVDRALSARATPVRVRERAWATMY